MWSFFSELDKDSWHIIHSVLITTVFRDELIKKVFTNDFKFSSFLSWFNPFNHFLIGLDLPNTITTHDNKIYVFISDFNYIRFSCNHLFLWRQRVIFLILSITKSSTKIKSAINSAESDCSSCFGNSINFLWIFWFVVSAEFFSSSLDTGNSSRVTSISTVNKLWSDKNDISGTSSMRFFLIFGSVIYLSHLFLNSYNLFFSFSTENQFIHP